MDLYLKMVSTDYLGEVYRLVMIKAAEAKLLSFGCRPGCALLRWLGLDTLAEFLTDPEIRRHPSPLLPGARGPGSRPGRGAGRPDRAAKLLCVGLASVLQFVGAGRDPKAPACVGLHGAAFSFPPVKTAWEHQVQTYLRDTLGLSVTLCYGENMLSHRCRRRGPLFR